MKSVQKTNMLHTKITYMLHTLCI